MTQHSQTTSSGPITSAGAWGLRYPGLVMGTGGKRRGQGVHRHVAPQARRRPGGVHEGAGPGRLDQSTWRNVLGADDEARADPNGALVCRQDPRLRRLDAVLRLSVRRHAREVLRRLRAQREGEPAGGLGPLCRLPDRPGCDGARHRASTSQAVRSRPWPVTTSLRASASPRSTRRLTGTRRRRSSSARSPWRRQARGQGRCLLEGPGQAVRARAERRQHRHGCRPSVAVRGRRRALRGEARQDGLSGRRTHHHGRRIDSIDHLEDRDDEHSTYSASLTAADLKDNLHDIQDNVVAPILMRYGRHVFLKFTDGANARAWLRNMFKRVNARREEHGTRFTVNIGFTYEGLKALGLSQRSLDSFPEAFRVGMRGRADAVGDVGPHAPEHWEGGLGGPDIHAMAWIRTDSDRRPRRGDADHSRRDGRDRRRRDPLRSGHDGARARKRDRVGRRAFRLLRIRSRSRRSRAPTRRRIPATACCRRMARGVPLKPGEFLLGYEDEAGADGTQAPEPFELRLNGTYLVFRKLYQDVAAFRRYLATAAKSLYGSDDAAPPGAGRGQDDGPLAQRLPARPVARQGRSRDRGRSSASQQLHAMQATTQGCAARSVRTCAAATRARRR